MPSYSASSSEYVRVNWRFPSPCQEHVFQIVFEIVTTPVFAERLTEIFWTTHSRLLGN